MRALAFAAVAALLVLSRPVAGQPAQPLPPAIDPSVPPQAETLPPPGGTAPPPERPVSSGTIQIDWQVKNRFRLFRNEDDFRKHADAHQGDGVLAAERRLAELTDGRGWAGDLIGRLCLDGTGRLAGTCERDGEKENYLSPEDHRIGVRLKGAVPPGAVCAWRFDDGTPPPQQISVPCTEEVRLRVRYGRTTLAAVGLTNQDGSVDSASADIQVRDILIAGLGDSVAAGEGNPDRPVALSDEGFCFRRFLGKGQYFRPSRAGYTGNKACDDAPGGPEAAAASADWERHAARWMSAACHNSLYGYQSRTALALAVEHPHIAVTFMPLACSGATMDAGIFGSQRARECPARGTCAGTVPGQLAQLQAALARAQKTHPERNLDIVLLTVGANDIRFSGMVADVILASGVERTLFNQGGLIASADDAQSILDHNLPADFVRLRAALKPMVGGGLSRVVFVSYGNPAMQGGAACRGGRDGFDVHPAFSVDSERLRRVSEFVSGQFLPKLKAMARCEGGAICKQPETDRMTYVDAHLDAFADRGVCARAEDDPEFDRACFSPKGESFNPDLASAATSPLVCDRRPNEFRPYASRKRWIRTANDSYFTAMTFPRGLPATAQPNSIHDAAWGAMSAVYGGAVHPTAEGHAAMADAALSSVRALLDLKPPPEFTAQPLPPLQSPQPLPPPAQQ
jgi:lysophospholipase L1-like esterase